MHRDFPFDKHTIQGLLALLASVGQSLRHLREASEREAPARPPAHSPEGGQPGCGLPGCGQPGCDGSSPEEAASRHLLSLLEHAVQEMRADVRPEEPRREEPRQEEPRQEERPQEQWPQKEPRQAEPPPAVAAPDLGMAAQTGVEPHPKRPTQLYWRRLLALPADVVGAGERRAYAWLRAKLQTLASLRRDPGISVTGRPPSSSKPPSSSRPASSSKPPSPPSLSSLQGKPLDQAMGPTLRRIRELAKRVPEEIRALLEKIAECFNDPTCRVHLIAREADATEWHGRKFRRALGISPGKLILELRVEVALRLLRDTSLPLENIARLVGYESLRGLELLFDNACGFCPSEARSHLRQVADAHRACGDELFSWYFWVRCHRGEVEIDDYLGALAYLHRRFSPA